MPLNENQQLEIDTYFKKQVANILSVMRDQDRPKIKEFLDFCLPQKEDVVFNAVCDALQKDPNSKLMVDSLKQIRFLSIIKNNRGTEDNNKLSKEIFINSFDDKIKSNDIRNFINDSIVDYKVPEPEIRGVGASKHDQSRGNMPSN